MKNYVTSAVLEEAPCLSYKVFINYKGAVVAKLKTSKGDFIAFYKSTPISLIRELASMKAGDKIDIFFRIITFEGIKHKFEILESVEPIKIFYDVKIHEGDIMRFKQCLWHEEEIPVIARIDMVKVKFGLPFEKLPKPKRLKNWMKPKKTEERNSGIVGFWLPSYQSFDIIVG